MPNPSPSPLPRFDSFWVVYPLRFTRVVQNGIPLVTSTKKNIGQVSEPISGGLSGDDHLMPQDQMERQNSYKVWYQGLVRNTRLSRPSDLFISMRVDKAFWKNQSVRIRKYSILTLLPEGGEEIQSHLLVLNPCNHQLVIAPHLGRIAAEIG